MSKEQTLHEALTAPRSLQLYFQPFVRSLDHAILGYEATMRGASDSDYHNPDLLISMLRDQALTQQANALFVERSLQQYLAQGLQYKLFLQYLPARKEQLENLVNAIQAVDNVPEFARARCVLCLPEDYCQQLGNSTEEDLSAALNTHLQGMALAVCKTSLSPNHNSGWQLLKPDYLILDTFLSRDVHEDNLKQQRIRGLMQAAKKSSVQLIAKGVETFAEYKALQTLGIPFVQGNLFAKPAKFPVRTIQIHPLNGRIKKNRTLPAPDSNTLETLISDSRAVFSSDSVASVANLFRMDHLANALPVLEQGIPIGVIHSRQVIDCLCQNSLEELEATTVGQVMSTEFPRLSKDLSLHELSQDLRADRVLLDGDQVVLVNGEGVYIGRVELGNLLKKVAELELRYARYANPLTQLPGSVPIHEKINQLLQSNAMFVVAYCDIAHFKPFNDAYGYVSGDEVILYVAELLKQGVDRAYDFLGHMGADDFTVIFQSPDWFERCEELIRECDLKAPDFYSRTHRNSGGIHTLDRLGQSIFHPFLALSIGAVPVEPGKFHSHHEVVAAALEVKKRASSTHGSAIFIDERSYRCDVTHQPLMRN